MTYFDKTSQLYLTSDKIELSGCEFEGSAETLKENIDDVVDRAKKKGMVGHGRFDVYIESYYEDDIVEIVYSFTRVATDEERAAYEAEKAKEKEAAKIKRKKAAAKKKMKQDAEYGEYERLKAKFEGM